MIDVHTHTFTRPKRSVAAASRRGVAMLLVIVAMGSATILTTSYLVSRSNSPGIGENATGAAAARWAAVGSADITEAILETEADWRSETSDGTLIENAALGGATVTVFVTDLEGNPPDGDDRDVVVSVEAFAGGVRAVEERIVNVQPDTAPEDAIDPELNEYAAFAADELRVEADAVVGVWPLSPAAHAGRSAKIGSGFTDMSKFDVDSGAIFHNVAFFPDDSAGPMLADMVDDSRFGEGQQVPLDLPAATAALPDALATLPVATFDGDEADEDLTLDQSRINAMPPGRYQNLTIEQGATITFGEAGQLRAYSVDDLTIKDNSAIRVVGDVALHVRGNMQIQNGSTVALDQASTGRVMIFAANDVTVQSSGLGVDPSIAQNPAPTPSDVTAYRHPGRLRILSLSTADGGNSSTSVQFKNQSIANAALHVPVAQIQIQDDSTLIGRATAHRIDVQSGSVLLYDPVLDRGVGFTSLRGPLYNDDGTPIDGLEDGLDNLSSDATLDEVTASLTSSIQNALGGLLDGGSGGSVSDRDDQRAEGRIWPIRALAFESGGASFTDIYDGSFLTVTGVTEDASDDTSGSTGGGTSGGGGGGGGGSTDDTQLQTFTVVGGEED